ncbi:DUF5763 domain-containing protein [Maribacter aestuarii]|uniref:DUF5763 domain-containing protein n=1 Tax=Maribacter aestuarii TaxID=1130723 RepID=UPI003D321257
MVENVSQQLQTDDITKTGLTPCKICKPPSISNLNKSNSFSNKAVGESASIRCNGITKKGARCKHRTSLANGFCYQHTSQNKTQKQTPSTFKKNSSVTSNCGARTKAGGYCKRKVSRGGGCYQHE